MLYSTMRGFGMFATTFGALIGTMVGGSPAAALFAAGPLVAGDQALADRRGDKAANEAKIAAALEERTELDFADQPLTDVIDYLKQRHEIEIQLESKALVDAGLRIDTPITRAIKGITLESALDLLLRDLDLTWVIHDEVLLITSNIDAELMIETRVYPVRDLLSAAPGKSPGTSECDYKSLVCCVTEAADPDELSKKVFPLIRVYQPAGALVITRPIRVHYRIEKLLHELRQAKSNDPARGAD